MLKISNVETFYGKIQALRGVDLDVNDGEIVSLIGSNGAGKSTLLMTISGVNKARRGNIVFNGENIENKDPHKIVDMGICQVPEGRRIFSRLTVEENLRLGAHANEKGKYFENDIKEVYNLFPVFTGVSSKMIGSSAGVMAILFYITSYNPNHTIRFFFLNIKLLYIAIFLLLMDIIQIPVENSGGHIAHLGGALIGFLMFRSFKGIDFVDIYTNLSTKKNNKNINENGAEIYTPDHIVLK